MKSKTYIKISLSLLLAGLILVAGMQIAIDPLFQYHLPWFGMKPVVTDERYQIPGMAKTFEYNNVIMGNSMSENFRVSDVNNVFGGESIKLTMAGSYALDWSYLLYILKDKHPLNIMLNISPANLAKSSTELVHELPEYLFDKDYFNDINCLLNVSIISNYTYDTVMRNQKGKITDFDQLFIWDNGTCCSREQALENYNRPDISQEDPDIDSYIQVIDENLDLLKPFFEEMSDTQFVLFVCPYSMLYWDSEMCTNGISKQRAGFLEMCKQLTEYNNVELYMWTDDEMLDVMSDLENYKDANHYSVKISKDILDRIGSRKGRITKDNYRQEINKLFEYIETFDYDSLFR